MTPKPRSRQGHASSSYPDPSANQARKSRRASALRGRWTLPFGGTDGLSTVSVCGFVFIVSLREDSVPLGIFYSVLRHNVL